MSNYNKGDIIKGYVRSIVEYGAFIDLPDDTSGLLHISEIDYNRVDNVWDYFSEGEYINVAIKEIKENDKISLTRKDERIIHKPKTEWDNPNFEKKYKIGTKHQIIDIERISDNYIIVNLLNNIDAIIPKTYIPESIIDIENYIYSNEIYGEVINVEKNKNKITLSIINSKKISENLEATNVKFNENNNNLYISLDNNVANDIKKIKKQNDEFFTKYDFSSFDNEDVLALFLYDFINEGIITKVFISNNSLKEKNLNLVLRFNLDENPNQKYFLPENSTLLFSGYLDERHSGSPVFKIKQITLSSDYHKKKFEVEREVVIFYSEDRVNSDYEDREDNIFEQQFIDSIPSASLIAKRKLSEWEQYLNWVIEYVNSNLFGYRYIHWNIIKNKFVFHVIVNSEKEKSKLISLAKKDDLQIYNINYSNNEWVFQHNEEARNKPKIIGEYVSSTVFSLKKDNKKKQSNNNNNNKEKKKNNKVLDIEYFESKDWRTSVTESEFNSPIVIELVFKFDDKTIERIEYAEENSIKDYKTELFKKYNPIGFIATSGVGTFAQINRQKRALNSVIEGKSYAPYLSSWLFDISNAENPKELCKIEEFNNLDLNNDQKETVEKMLSVPNIGLVQGPPGTGKTTVIAEIIYQLAKQGKRVVLSSQSNLAVDNALERLPEDSIIRAIRLGKKEKVSDDAAKFIEENIINSFYKNIALKSRTRFVESKDSIEQKKNYLTNKQGDLIAVIKKSDNYKNEIDNLKLQLSKLNKDKENNLKIEQENNKKEALKEKLNKFCKFIVNDKEPFFLPKDIIDKITNNSKSDIRDIEELKINMFSKELFSKDTDEERKNKIIRTDILKLKMFLNNLESINNDIELIKLGNKDTVSFEETEIKKSISKIDDELEVVDEESSLFRDLWKKRKQLKQKLKEIEKKSIFSKPFYKDIFNDISFLVKLEDSNKKELIGVLAGIINLINPVLGIIESFTQNANNVQDSVKIIELNNDKINNAKIENTKEQIIEKQESYQLVSQKIKELIADVTKTYDLQETKDYNNILSEIQSIIDAFDYRLKNSVSAEMSEFIKHWSNNLNNKETIENDKEYIIERYIENSNVVGITVNENPKTIENKGFSNFDVAIIDEVSKATPPELLFIMSIAKKVILVGDHRQLPPVFTFREENALDQESIQEQFEQNKDNKLLTPENFKKFKNMVTASLFKEYFEKADISIKHSLLTQYRMHPQIMDSINYFYEKSLKLGLKNPDIERAHNINYNSVNKTRKIIAPNKHILWIDSSKKLNGDNNYEEQRGNSKINMLEIDIIQTVLEGVNNDLSGQGYNENNKKEVGVISFYGKQVSLLRSKINKNKYKALKIDINTVDKFQGKEKALILVSMVRNKKILRKHKKYQEGRDIAFVAQFERINVAFSRAQELLVVVGAKDMFIDYEVKLPKMNSEGFNKRKVYSDIIGYISSKDGLLETKDILKKN